MIEVLDREKRAGRSTSEPRRRRQGARGRQGTRGARGERSVPTGLSSEQERVNKQVWNETILPFLEFAADQQDVAERLSREYHAKFPQGTEFMSWLHTQPEWKAWKSAAGKVPAEPLRRLVAEDEDTLLRQVQEHNREVAERIAPQIMAKIEGIEIKEEPVAVLVTPVSEARQIWEENIAPILGFAADYPDESERLHEVYSKAYPGAQAPGHFLQVHCVGRSLSYRCFL